VHSLVLPSSPLLSGEPAETTLDLSRILPMALTSSSAIRPLLLPTGKADLIPVEILSEVFLLAVQDWRSTETDLMLVCHRWYAIVLSTPGLTSRLHIRRSTTKEVVQAFIQGRRTRLSVDVNMGDVGDGKDFNVDDFIASFMAAVQAASRWRSLYLTSFPPLGEYKASRTIVQPLESLQYFYMSQSCDLGDFFEPLMSAITTIAPSNLTYLQLRDLSALLYLCQPSCLHVFCSLTTLEIFLFKRMESPANILPHLHRLRNLGATYLHIPIYPPDASLPLIQTLESLFLRSVSVQWMAGKVFPALRRCSITFPHHIDTICLQPVAMPACSSLEFDSNGLGPLRYFHHLPLKSLTVTSGQWNARRGSRQLVAMCPIVLASAQSLTRLRLHVQCSEQLLTCMLGLVPALRSLTLGLASPRALSVAFFQAITAATFNAGSPCGMVALPSLSLWKEKAKLILDYKRWLRGPERTALIPVFGDIVSSHWLGEDFSLILRFGEHEPWLQVQKPVERICAVPDYEGIMIGISSPRGIIPLERTSVDPLREVPFDGEYFVAHQPLSMGCLLTFHDLVELRVRYDRNILPTALPPNLPLFRTLRVLDTKNIHPSFLAGQTFHKLERCRVSLRGEHPKLSEGPVTHMPVCTRLDVEDTTLLATLKLPQICELGASFDHPEFNMIWGTHIAVNANLSGLKLLHVYGWGQQAGLIQVLRCLPVLESLILGKGSYLDADFFGEFVSMDPNMSTVLRQSSDGCQISAILCPLLKRLLIERFDPTKTPERILLSKEVVSLRALGGSPLRRFTLFDFEYGRKFELIGQDGSFVVIEEVLHGGAKPFKLDI
jgi:hypothetical protein